MRGKIFLMARRRSTLEVYASMLKRTSVQPLSISRVILIENLSHKEAKKHLDKLVASGMMQKVVNGRSKLYSTTSKGLEFVSNMRNILATLATKEPQVGPIIKG